MSGAQREWHQFYHDKQYGFPIHDDDELFARLILEINQAGLSWETILKKQARFRNYPLAKTITNYGFFSYPVSEALYFSDKEKEIIFSVFRAMLVELDTNIDQFSQDVMVSQIELFNQ